MFWTLCQKTNIWVCETQIWRIGILIWKLPSMLYYLRFLYVFNCVISARKCGKGDGELTLQTRDMDVWGSIHSESEFRGFTFRFRTLANGKLIVKFCWLIHWYIIYKHYLINFGNRLGCITQNRKVEQIVKRGRTSNKVRCNSLNLLNWMCYWRMAQSFVEFVLVKANELKAHGQWFSLARIFIELYFLFRVPHSRDSLYWSICFANRNRIYS